MCVNVDSFARLVEGPDSSSGRVELLHNGQWGTICDDGFTVPDAAVICTMLGYNNSNPQVLLAPQFAYGSGPIFLKNVVCRGSESDIEECSHSKWGVTDCQHAEDVGIDCSTDIRLVGGTGPFEGRVEVFHNGEWGTVCSNGFDSTDAGVFCRMLGYKHINPVVIPISKFKSGFGSIWMDNLMCSGREVDIALCKFNGWDNPGNCTHSQDVAISCGNHIKVRLSGGRGAYEGRLEISDGISWLPVCRNGFTMDSAKVVCKHFGYPVSENDPSVVASSEFSNNVSADAYNVHCTGGEIDVAICDINITNPACSSRDFVGIKCPRTDIRLISSSLPSSGRVEVYHGGRWGSVCGHSFDSKAAEVMCRMLGFKPERAQFFRNSKFGKSTEAPLIDNMVCSGFENDIAACRFTWTSRACNDDANIGLTCVTTPVRLENGAGPWEGRVEILRNGDWSTLCDESFGVAEASVICKMLGFKELYTSPRAKLSSLFGPSNAPARLSMMSCSGTELDVHACIQGVWGSNTCDRSHEAGVDCSESNLRLTGGSHNMEGRVELLVNGMWSAICDDDWDNIEATVVCKTLAGYPFDRSVTGKAFRNSFFGPGNGKIAYSRVKCNGTEIDVMHCSLIEVTIPTCDHSNEAGVSCILNEQVKLSGPNNTTSGTVIVNMNGNWDTLCDTGFGSEEARVICRELGYWSSTARSFSNSWYATGNGTSRDLRPQCAGIETKIAFCPLGKTWNEQTCSHAHDAGIQCTTTPIDLSNIRLIDGKYPGMGKLEIKYNNRWGSFCWRRWNEQNTKVLCRMLRYSHTEGKAFSSHRNKSAISIGSLRCQGQENNIGYCKAYLDKETCNDEAVGVDCTGNMKVKLKDGQTVYSFEGVEGRVDIYDGHNWGSLCDNSITTEKAKVICSTATGYRDTQPVFYHLTVPEFHSAAFSVDSLTCGGWEEHISQCTFTKTGSCSVHFTHVKCFQDCVTVYSNVSTGDITSNNYPKPYEPDVDCLYIIKPSTGIYKLEFLDLQMADSGDFVQVKDKLQGHILGHFTIFSGVTPIFGNQFYIRYKTNSQDESKGFHLRWSVADVSDTVSVNCQNSKWGAGLNLTSLQILKPRLRTASKIFLNVPTCYGFIYDDLLLFQQLYDQCHSNKTISNGFVTYTNRIVYIENGVQKWETPIKCRKQQITRVSHTHFFKNKRSAVIEDDSIGFNFKTTFYYNWKESASEDIPFAFNQTYFYEIVLSDNDSDLTFVLESCTLQQQKNGKDVKISVIQNNEPVNGDVTLMILSRETKVLGINVNEDLDSLFTCDVKVTFE
ncbi:DMBT1 [Mytilus coruscus]|uniref:DMBT1 n=1 Tax=Mytilus coruscus TaxID=42192 RepID=A0A6J8BKK9_MYTCO|nr:DMBT1 [Mytilus coruscus]